MKNKNTFLVACVCSIMLLLTMCYFGINSSSTFKGTSATDVSGYYCDNIGWEAQYVDSIGDYLCCPSEYTYMIGAKLCYSAKLSVGTGIQAESYCNELGYDYSYETGSSSGYYCTVASTKPKSCYYCGYDRTYYWESLNYQDSAGTCTPVEEYTSQSTCEAQNDSQDSSSDTSDARCYCFVTEDGETCKTATVNPGGSYVLSDDSKCSSDETGSGSSKKACFKHTKTNGYGQTHTLYSWLSYTEYNGKSGYELQSNYETEDTCLYANSHGCWYCPDSNLKYHWSADYYVNSSYCTKDSSITTQSVCEAKNSSNDDSGDNETPSFTPQTFELTFKDYDETVIKTDSCNTTQSNQTTCRINVPSNNPEREGYTFVGWSHKEDDCSIVYKYYFDITSDKVTHACYTKNSQTVAPETPDDSDKDETPDDSNDSDQGTSKPEDDNKNQNVDKNPGTGEIAIFIVWLIGIAAIVYSVWYFKTNKENN